MLAFLGMSTLQERDASRSRFARFHTDDPAPGGGGAPPVGGGGAVAPTLEQLQAQIADMAGKHTAAAKERDDLAAKLKGIEDANLSEAEYSPRAWGSTVPAN